MARPRAILCCMRRILPLLGLLAVLWALEAWADQSAPTTPAERAARHMEAAQQSLSGGKADVAYRQLEAAQRALWPALKLSVRALTLVKEPAGGYGMFTPRVENSYSIMGEPIHIYLEPVGYAVASEPNGEMRLALSMDARLLDSEGKELYAIKDFMRQTIFSRRFKREFFLNVTLNIEGAPPGAYTVVLKLKDLVGGKTSISKLPIRFLSPAAISAENRRRLLEQQGSGGHGKPVTQAPKTTLAKPKEAQAPARGSAAERETPPAAPTTKAPASVAPATGVSR